MRTVRALDDEIDDNEGEADRGGETDDAFEVRRDRATIDMVGNSVGPFDDAMLSLVVWCIAILRSVCRLFWNHTVTERSSLYRT